jgi:UDP-N-acetylmuramate--alanine ligase
MKKVHFIGIGGTGISAIARMLLERGWRVSGSDLRSSPYFEAVTALGAQTVLGHAPALAKTADLVVRSSAVRDDDPEVRAARENGIPVLKRSEFLPVLTEGYQVIAVAGSHGKTTTTAMLVQCLRSGGSEVNFILGADIKELGKNAQAADNPAFVIEADEYDYMFLGLQPLVSVVTNIEYDHPDFFHSPEVYTQAFADFINQTRPEGSVLLCADDEGILAMLENCDLLPKQMLSYGFRDGADYQIINHRLVPGGQRFELSIHGQTPLGPFELNLPGRFNVLNAAAALASAHIYGSDLSACAKALAAFEGTSRRFDLVYQNANWMVINDYGHHPSQLSQTIEGAHQLYPDHTIWAVWEPHTVSRTRLLRHQFAQALAQADRSVILRLYGAREADDSFSPADIAQEAGKENSRYLPENQAAVEHILANRTGKDLVIVFSAGNGPEFARQLVGQLSKEQKND